MKSVLNTLFSVRTCGSLFFLRNGRKKGKDLASNQVRPDTISSKREWQKDVLALHYILKLQKLVGWKCALFQIQMDERAFGSQGFVHNNSDHVKVWEFVLFYKFDPGVRKQLYWKNF